MTKTELIRKVAEATGQKRQVVAEVVNAFLSEITAALRSGERVSLLPFGTFNVVERKARICRNPQTGRPIRVPARRVVKFRSGRTLREAVESEQ